MHIAQLEAPEFAPVTETEETFVPDVAVSEDSVAVDGLFMYSCVNPGGCIFDVGPYRCEMVRRCIMEKPGK